MPSLSGNTNASDNETLFNSISGEWTVPTGTQHTAAQAEASSDGIGIGGGCVDSGCDATDSTLIQTGTEQDVSSTGAASYDAWIEETPLEIGTDAGFAALPNLTNPGFTDATANGSPADLQTSQEMDLVDSDGDVIGTPPAPSPDSDGFNACAWASTCSAPTSG